MHGNSKFRLSNQLFDAKLALQIQLEHDPENARMIAYYQNEIARLTNRVYGSRKGK